MLESEKYKLSTYRVIETVRKTNDASVSLVQSTQDEKRYIQKTYAADKREVYRLLREIESAGVPKIHEIFFAEDTIIIEEYVEGKTLGSLIREKHLFSPAELMKLTESLTDALSVLHKNNIIHRDVKPDNIILKPDGTAVLIDYGIARVYSPDRTEDTEHFGTAGYAAPEQYGFTQSDFRTDIYALGITLKAAADLGDAPKKLLQAISRCTEFDPGKRFQSADELRAFLFKSKKSARIKRIAAVFSGAIVLGALALCLCLLRPADTQIPGGTDAFLCDITEGRIITTDAQIPCLQLKEPRTYSASVTLGEGLPPVTLEATLNETALVIVLDGNTSFTFTDDSGLSTASYPDGSTFAEILLYDMNGDGIAEIVPVISNAKRAEWADGSVSLLRNYSLAWCIYEDGGVFRCAEERMTAQMDPFKIYASMPGYLSADFPSSYTLENGEILLH